MERINKQLKIIQWKYRESESEEWNFQRWKRWTNDERDDYCEPLLDDDEAKIIWDNKIFNNLKEDDYE
jgi:hypothetical protein